MLSFKIKILIAIILIYTIVISVLLIIAGKRLSNSNSDDLKFTQIELLVTDLKKTNYEYNKSNLKAILKLDSIRVIINRMEVNLEDIKNKKITVNSIYNSKIEKLKGKSLDSLKIIALQP